ncbi:MAG: glycosyltransferase [candidate division Zixibacteria bacterium]|nr:glycosyltransferase [candidate division Zixibacteria bacterium]
MQASISDYQKIIGKEHLETIYRIAERLSGKRVKMINSTSVGGGVAEILYRFVPLMNELGIQTFWEVIKGDGEFFNITKSIHNSLHGKEEPLTQEMEKKFLEVNQNNARSMSFDEDYVFIHDPQPIALIEEKDKHRTRWIWRCHIDISSPLESVWNFLKNYVEMYDVSIFSAPNFARMLKIPQYQIPPSIDPLSPKNREVRPREIENTLKKYKINPERPIITQVSRFDKLKDPLGVIHTYRLVKKTTDCQLILAGGTATDDPESVEILPQVLSQAEGDPDIHIIELPPNSDLDVNILQRASTIILQKSLKEGFALTVTEALWKKKPVVASAVGGIPLQVIHNYTGLLVHSVEGAAYKIRYLLNNPDLARRLGENGYQHVRHNFLITRHLRDYLLLLIALDHPGENIINLG